MAFLDSVTVPKSSGGFLGSITAAPKGFTAPPPTQAPAPQPSLLEKAIGYIKDSVVNQFQAGIQQANAGSKEANAPGANLGNRLEGALGTLSGAASAITSPLAPIFAPVGAAANFVGSKIGEIPAVQQFAQTPASDVVRKGAEIAQNVGNVAGALSLLEGGAKSSSLVEKAPVEPHFLDTVVSPEPKIVSQETAPRTIAPAPTTGTMPSKVGASIEQGAIEKGLTESFGGTAGYDPITIKDQAAKVTALVERDPLGARAMALGETPIPSDIRSSALLVGLEDHAMKTGDVQLLKDLAQSPLTSETSVHAQELRLLAERAPDSPVGLIRSIGDARVKSVEKRSGSIKTAVTKEVNNIKGEMKKTNTKQTWSDFVQEITCSY